MCAIGGEIDFASPVKVMDYHKEMISSMKRRGPDDDGIFQDENALLLHARLAVIDVEKGRQPMTFCYRGETYTIVYNGEIYNTKELRKNLENMGMVFETSSDTEVLLKLYAVYKEECTEMLNGIFAFAVWEKNAKRLFMARDKIGVKPFFYHKEGDRLVFASEIKTILLHPQIDAVIDRKSIAELMLIGPGRTPGYGVFKGINELKRGHMAYFDKDGLRITKYWDVTARKHTDSKDRTIEKVRFLVKDAIERQLVSDVPIGTFLSGGLDSSIISSVAASYMKKRGEKLDTFSVTYRDNDKYFKKSRFQPNSDEMYIDIMQKYLNSRHHTIVIDTPELAEALKASVDARDLPGMADVDSSLLLFCKEIKKHVTVALSGESADEIFGGYPWYRDEKIRMAYGFPWAQSTDYRSTFLNKDINIDANEYVNGLYDEYISEAPKYRTDGDVDTRMKEMVYLNMNWFMQTLLDRKDRMSMYSGLEVRVPFCDWRIADYMYSVPWEYKDLFGREKGLLRAAAEGILPPEILYRKKSPYPKTHNPSYKNMVSAMLRETCENKESPIFKIADYDAVVGLLDTDREEPWYGQLMATPQTMAYMIQLNYWMEKFNVKIEL
jgi:asparagine synthase (glutamine-hydrolysing)